MTRIALAALLLVSFAFAAPASAERKVRIYRPLSRSAEELLAPAQAALGADGSATVDSGTNALVLIGEPRAVESALGVLAQLDRPLATVILHYESQRLQDLEARGAHVAWSVSAGSFRVGNVSAPPGQDLVALHPFDDGKERRSKLAGMLRLQDGQSGRIETGTELPIVQSVSPWQTQVGSVRASSGFEARPQLLGDGRVRVSLQPFEGALEPGGAVQTSGAATEVTVAPGDTVAVGGLRQDRAERSRGLGGAAEVKDYEDWVLLLRAEVEGRAPSPR